MDLNSLCVFPGSSLGKRPEYGAVAREVGVELARRKIRLIYGAGRVGLMGVVADACLENGGEVVGIIPQHIVDLEVAHTGLSQLIVVDTMHERKQLMADRADAFVALPGGFGTFEEFCEVITWSQLGLHPKPCGILNVAGFYDPLLQLFDHAVAQEFVRPVHREMVLVDTDVNRLLSQLTQFESAYAAKFP